MRHQQRDFMLWVTADKPQNVTQIAFIHANQMIIPCIIQPGHLPGGLAAVSYTHLDVYKRQELVSGGSADAEKRKTATARSGQGSYTEL